MGFREKFRNAEPALTFNDVLLLPGWTTIEPSQADVGSRVTKAVELNVPFISSPMDTVTGSEMAVALARHGGLGVLHRNCTRQEEVEMARHVKRAEALIIRDIVTVRPDFTINDLVGLMEEHNIHGFPVVDEGDRLVGIVTWRDFRLADKSLKVEDVMTKEVITAGENTSLEEAKTILHEHRIEKLPIVNEAGKVTGLITMRDITLKGTYPGAVRDELGRLICAAAISPFDLERAIDLDEYVDILVTDVAHFHNSNCFDATKKVLDNVTAEVVVGNIGTYEAAEDCLTKLDGVAGLRVGIGSGSICSTSIVTRAGAPTLYACAQVADAVKEYGSDVTIIADGDVPGVPDAVNEGVEGWVPYRGSVSDIVSEFVGGLKAAMGYVGARTIPEMSEKARLALVTERGAQEISPHDIMLPGPREDRRG